MSTAAKYRAISPLQEFLAYEALWDRPDSSFRSLAQELHDYPVQLASTLISAEMIDQYKNLLLPVIKDLSQFGIRIYPLTQENPVL